MFFSQKKKINKFKWHPAKLNKKIVKMWKYKNTHTILYNKKKGTII